MLEARTRDDEIAASACMDTGGRKPPEPVFRGAAPFSPFSIDGYVAGGSIIVGGLSP